MNPEPNSLNTKKPCCPSNGGASEQQNPVQPIVGVNDTDSVLTGIETVRSTSNAVAEHLRQVESSHSATGHMLDALGNAVGNVKNLVMNSGLPMSVLEQINEHFVQQMLDVKFKPIKDILGILCAHQANICKHLENLHVIQINNQNQLENLMKKSSEERYNNRMNEVLMEVGRLANDVIAKKQAAKMESLKDNCFQGEDGEIYAIQKVEPCLVEALEARYGPIVVEDDLDVQLVVPRPVNLVDMIEIDDFQTNASIGNLAAYLKQDFSPKMLSRRSKSNLANPTTSRPASIRNRGATSSQQNAEPQVERDDSLPGLP